jgi:hypothetical protein
MELVFAIGYLILALAEGSIIILQASKGELGLAIIWLVACILMTFSSGLNTAAYIAKKIG